MQNDSFIYLASQSPRRKELLDRLGVHSVPLLPDASEDAEAIEEVRPRETLRSYVLRVGQAKAQAALKRLDHRVKTQGLPLAPILVADTAVGFDRNILGKPTDAADAKRILRILSDRTHIVYTMVVVAKIVNRQPHIHRALVDTKVKFRALSDWEIDAYVATTEPFGKAGAYALQGLADVFVERITGSVTNVVGLPLEKTHELLQRVNVKTALEILAPRIVMPDEMPYPATQPQMAA